MSNPSEGEVTPGQVSLALSHVAVSMRGSDEARAQEWLSESINRHNMTILAMISLFLAGVDTVQSFYLQRVVNQFNEVNLLPLKFYSTGLVGYLLYTPIDFLALYGTLTMLWIWASYLLWYYKRYFSHRFHWFPKPS